MNILVISPVLPYPPVDGDRLRIYNFLKYLSKWNKIYLLSFIYKSEEKNVDYLNKICSLIKIVYIDKNHILFNALKSIFSSIPINIGAYTSQEMKNKVDEILKQEKIDLIYAYRIRCAPYAANKNIPAVIDIVDSMALVNKRRDEFENDLFRKLYIKIDYTRLLNYEKNLYKFFRKIFVNSEDDEKFLNTQNMEVIANGVAGKIYTKHKNKIWTIGFFGNIEYGPNYDGIIFFYKNIWKKISEFDKNIRLVIAGDQKNKLKDITKDKSIEIKGYIEDIDKEISKWDISLVPVRYGAGRQNKILKSWACGIPVVATKFAAMGVYGKNEYNLLIADKEEEFINAIYQIKNNKRLKEKIIKGGFLTVKKYFNWEKNLKKLKEIIRKVK